MRDIFSMDTLSGKCRSKKRPMGGRKRSTPYHKMSAVHLTLVLPPEQVAAIAGKVLNIRSQSSTTVAQPESQHRDKSTPPAVRRPRKRRVAPKRVSADCKDEPSSSACDDINHKTE